MGWLSGIWRAVVESLGIRSVEAVRAAAIAAAREELRELLSEQLDGLRAEIALGALGVLEGTWAGKAARADALLKLRDAADLIEDPSLRAAAHAAVLVLRED